MPDEMVRIKHKSSKKSDTQTAQVSRRAYESIWKDKGWVIADEGSTKKSGSKKKPGSSSSSSSSSSESSSESDS